MPPHSFKDLNLCTETVDALLAHNIEFAFPIQSKVIPDAIEGRDVLVQSPTGSGKTLAFAIPIVERTFEDDPCPSALILVPTRELAAQVVEEFRMLTENIELDVTAVYGGLSLAKQGKDANKSHIVVATPGRLNDLAQRRMIDLSNVHTLVLDEADRMLDMGFQPQVDRIVSRIPQDRHTMFFSATLEGKVGRVAKQYTHDAVRHEHVQQTANDKPLVSIEHIFIACDRHSRYTGIVEMLKDDRGLALVFVRTRRGADELVSDLNRDGIGAVAMHGDMTQKLRERTLERFESGKITTLVATDVAARGLDLDDITHVFNFDAPEETPQYVHRVGRTGRAGRTGTAVTFVMEDQQRVVGQIARKLGLSEQYESVGLKTLAPRMAYASRSRGRLGPRPGAWRR